MPGQPDGGLGAEGIQLFEHLRRELHQCLRVQRAVVIVAGQRGVALLVLAHGRDEQVKRVGFALPVVDARIQVLDRQLVLPRATIDRAQLQRCQGAMSIVSAASARNAFSSLS